MKVWTFHAFCWEIHTHAPKTGVFRQFDTLSEQQYQRNRRKHTLAWKDVVWRIDRQKIHWCDLCTWLGIKKRQRTQQWQTKDSHRPPTSSDQDTVLHGGWPSCDSYKFQVSSKSAKWLRRCEGSKSGLLHYFGHWIIQQPVRPYRPDLQPYLLAGRCGAVSQASLFHGRTRACYVYNVCLAWYNVVLTHGSTQAWNS